MVIAGTGVNSTAARFVYAPMARMLDAEVVALPRLGMADPLRAATLLSERLTAPTALVGHSQGGLVAALTASMVPEMVSHLVVVCAPLAGTRLASRLSPFSGVRAMAPDSKVCRSLKPHAATVSIVASRDRTVVPFHSGVVIGMPSYTFDCGHIEIIFRHDVLTLIKEICDDRCSDVGPVEGQALPSPL